MRRTALILGNDVRRRMRRPMSIVLMMLIPLTLTLMIGLVFGRSGDVRPEAIPVLVVDRDKGLGSRFLLGALRQGPVAEMLDVTEVSPEEGERLMEGGKASALIEVPQGFTGNLLDGERAVIRVVKNPAESFSPLIVEEIVESTAVIIDAATRIFADPLDRMRAIWDADRWPSGGELDAVLSGARSGIILAEPYIADSLIVLEEIEAAPGDTAAAASGASGSFNLFAYVLPGSMMIGLLFISELMLRDLLREASGGTLRRLLASPVGTGEVIAAKVGATYAVTLIACAVLLAVGRLAFSIGLGAPLPLSLHVLATILMCTGVMTFLYGLVRSERAADAIMSVAIIVMAMAGGSMIPVDAMGGVMRGAARFSPVYWASEGLKLVLIEGAGVGGIARHLAVLAAVGAATLVAGGMLLRGRIGRGG